MKYKVWIYDSESGCNQPMECEAKSEAAARKKGREYIKAWHLIGAEITKVEMGEYLKVGSYKAPDEDGNGGQISREYYRQGEVFKDAEAFYNRPDDPCYIPELSDTVYTRNDILAECDGNEELAEEVFENLDWQHVSSTLEDWQRNGEIDNCPKCGRLFSSYGVKTCPFCGAPYEGGEGL